MSVRAQRDRSEFVPPPRLPARTPSSVLNLGREPLSHILGFRTMKCWVPKQGQLELCLD